MNLDDVERLLKLMDRHELVEVEIEDPEKGTRVRLRKANPERNSRPLPAPALPAAPEAPAWSEGGEAGSGGNGNVVEIPSPMVGTFYRASSPDSDPFVEVGDEIDGESVICIIEAMKVMNEIKAEVSGEVIEILVQNGEAVEYGQPLFLVRTEPAASA